MIECTWYEIYVNVYVKWTGFRSSDGTNDKNLPTVFDKGHLLFAAVATIGQRESAERRVLILLDSASYSRVTLIFLHTEQPNMVFSQFLMQEDGATDQQQHNGTFYERKLLHVCISNQHSSSLLMLWVCCLYFVAVSTIKARHRELNA